MHCIVNIKFAADANANIVFSRCQYCNVNIKCSAGANALQCKYKMQGLSLGKVTTFETFELRVAMKNKTKMIIKL